MPEHILNLLRLRAEMVLVPLHDLFSEKVANSCNHGLQVDSGFYYFPVGCVRFDGSDFIVSRQRTAAFRIDNEDGGKFAFVVFISHT